MLVVPEATADTTPVDEPIVAADGLLLVHVPAPAELVSVVVAPAHSAFAPLIVPIGLTVISCVAVQPVGAV